MVTEKWEKASAESKCKNEIADILLKYNCQLIGRVKIDDKIYGSITKDILRQNTASLLLAQSKIMVKSK